jgi:hypothetical protein
MDMKNTAILLIFLLCVLGLAAGVYYTEANESAQDIVDYDEVIHEDSNGTITISIEPKNSIESKLSGFFI